MNLDDLDTPTLLVDLDRLERNITRMAERTRAHGKRLRPHAKTHKCAEIARMQIEAGAVGLTVAKLGEAEAFADAGITDLFIANQIVGPQKVARLIELSRRARVRVGVDSREAARPLALAARAAGLTVPVLIEIDTGLGRAGTRSHTETHRLVVDVLAMPGLEWAGVFTHEGHLYRAANDEERRLAARDSAQYVDTLLFGLLRELDFPPERAETLDISFGSTPGAVLLADSDVPTELRPGNYVFHDRTQLELGSCLPEDCALTVLVTVTSVRPDGRIVIDAGTKTLAGDRMPDGTMGAVVGYPELTFEGASEEHGHLQAQGAHTLRVGDRLRVLPNHACTCLNLHDTLTAYRGETVEAVWPLIARGKIQ